MHYYILVNGRETGPLSLEQVRQYRLQPASRVWRSDLPNWVEARDLDELKELLVQPPPVYGHSNTAYQGASNANRYMHNFDSASFLAKLDKDYSWMIGSCIALLGSLVLTVFIGVSVTAASEYGNDSAGSIFALVIAALILMAAVVLTIVFFCKVQYAFWTIVQDGTDKPKPGEAVGFLFIPFFSWYWIFVSFNRLSKELNKMADERDPGGYQRADEGVSLTYCILILCSIIPFLGYLAMLARIILFFIMMANHKKVVHRIANASALSF